jgi:hypothetical protein
MAGTVTANIDTTAEVFCGEDKALTWTVTTDGVSVVDITGWTFLWEMRLTPYHATLVLTEPANITGAPSAGKVLVQFPSADTKVLKAGKYFYGLARSNAGAWDVIADGYIVFRKSGVHAP